ncbi:preprotein translocase subunit YidC [Trypanosoma rangeli]|uniref:Preprotein translocase subunit YidC n=1 Tax=Trypanosoma rangeli TaxID=5698 RepID=A0A422P166_TRYRA|nr:preprotein translocase subunit YidC [Trypanosoma rangeli]RNF11476.1 preprotein translocase subunit YidC [Trypanosoma rangeli]|eukprot:RNF11476.1 preprotein translocase subunit YidC [Trypanosoma rangeli]
MQRVGRRIPLRGAIRCPFLVTSRRAVSVAGGAGGVASLGSGGGNEGHKTYFEYLDCVWNRQWFGATESLPPLPDASPFADIFVTCQAALGLDSAIAIILFGALSRLCTLYFSLYGERASERMRTAMRRLKVPHEAFQRVYYREGSAALDIQLAAIALKGERRRIFLEEKTSNLQCLSSLLGTPLVLFGIIETTAMCENPRYNIGTSSFLWCPALTMTDPYGILPLTFCGLTLMNFELSISKDLKNGWMSTLVWGARLGCLCVLPAAAHIRAGVALYFLGMSLVGLLQPLLLRSTAFRAWFNFPAQQSQLEPTKAVEKPDDLHARMCVQFPYLTHLFNPESEENTGFLKDKAATSQNDFQRRCNTAGYARGMNPLMREEPPRPMSGWSSTSFPAAAVNVATVPSRKGANFAAGRWKATQTEFREEDFIPEVADAGQSSGKGKQ